MGRTFPGPGSATQRAWIEAMLARAANAASRRATATALAPRPEDGLPVIEAWTGDGVPVITNAIGQSNVTATADGAGGAIFAFQDYRNGLSDIYANRLDVNGNTASGWSSDGFPVAVTDSFEVLVASCTDGSGGALIGWNVLRPSAGEVADIYLQHVTTAGALGSGWPVNGKRYAIGPLVGYDLRSDGAGGAYLGWLDPQEQPWLLHVDGSGNPVSGWPAAGLAIGAATNTEFDLAPDGAGGLFRVWASNDSVFCTRLAADGTYPAGWTADGALICSGSYSKSSPSLVRLSTGNVMIAWSDDRSFDLDLFAQCITPSGTIPAPWPLNGVQVCGAAGPQTLVKLVADGLGGAIAVWEDFRDSLTANSLFAQRVAGNSSVGGGSWLPNGNRLCDVSVAKGGFIAIPDNANGVDVVWTDNRSGTSDVFAQRLISSGARPPGFPSGGATISGAPGNQDSPVAVTDGTNGVIAGWDDSRSGLRVYAGKVLGDGTVGVEASLVSASAGPGRVRLQWFSPGGPSFVATLERDAGGAGYVELATVRADGTGNVSYEDDAVSAGVEYRYRLIVNDGGTERILGEVTVRVPARLLLSIGAVRPNPSSGPLTAEFTLPGAEPARLEVLDVAGRRALSREVTLGAGEHVVRLEESAALQPGVYLLRLTQGGRSVTTRASIAR